jgi:hypothetical protein
MDPPLSTVKQILLGLLRIAGYTWYKTYRTIELLGEDSTAESPRIVKWLEHKQSELNFASLIV